MSIDYQLISAAWLHLQVNQDIWQHPEVAFMEERAHRTLVEFLGAKGFQDIHSSYVLPTGFRAEYGCHGDGPNVAVICEYDALPEIGHACGHNLIAEVGVGAALGIKAALEAAAQNGCRVGKVIYDPRNVM
jgi:metal-dependent amidase/aminoacylase/carboxypeptidase family protein